MGWPVFVGGIDRRGLVLVFEEVLVVGGLDGLRLFVGLIVSLTNSALPALELSRLVLVVEALFSSAVS